MPRTRLGAGTLVRATFLLNLRGVPASARAMRAPLTPVTILVVGDRLYVHRARHATFEEADTLAQWVRQVGSVNLDRWLWLPGVTFCADALPLPALPAPVRLPHAEAHLWACGSEAEARERQAFEAQFASVTLH
jgi:hypothetical protein